VDKNALKTILITGANGFVGTNLYHNLSGDFRLLGLDITGNGAFPPEDLYDWTDLDRLPPVDAIIHLAGKAHDTANTGREEEYFEINLGLTQKIFNWFLQSQSEKFIFFSSVKAITDTVKGEWLTEQDVPDPQTPYGRSKLAAEQYIIERLNDHETKVRGSEGARERGGEGAKERGGEGARERGSEGAKGRGSEGAILESGIWNLESKIIYILRPAMIHGPGNKGNLNLLYKMVKKGIPWPLGAFVNQRSFASMDNVAFVIRQILEKPVSPGIYNLADDEPLSTREIIRLIAESQGKNPVIWNIPRKLIIALAYLGDLVHLPLNRERLKKLTDNYRVSNTKIKTSLGIETLPVEAKEGLMITLKNFCDLNG